MANQPQQTPPNQAGQPQAPPNQAGQPAGDLHARAATAGFDLTKFFDFVKSLDWPAIIALVRTIWSTWTGGAGARPRMRAVAPGQPVTCGPEDVACLKDHFTMIGEIAACGANCCGG